MRSATCWARRGTSVIAKKTLVSCHFRRRSPTSRRVDADSRRSARITCHSERARLHIPPVTRAHRERTRGKPRLQTSDAQGPDTAIWEARRLRARSIPPSRLRPGKTYARTIGESLWNGPPELSTARPCQEMAPRDGLTTDWRATTQDGSPMPRSLPVAGRLHPW